MTTKDNFVSYTEFDPYRNVVELIRHYSSSSLGVFVDLGCRYRVIAEKVTEFGLRYFGLDIDPDRIAWLNSRDFAAVQADLLDIDDILRVVEMELVDSRLAGIAMLDVLEQIPGDPVLYLTKLSEFSAAHGNPPLFLSVPNVARIDIIYKLLFGRWDTTTPALLDDKSVAVYSEYRLAEVLSQSLWNEIEENDSRLDLGDQHFPSDLMGLGRGHPLYAFLSSIRERSGSGATIHHFVRAYIPQRSLSLPERQERQLPFLSVLMRTQGRRIQSLNDALLCLAAQTSDHFEVILLAHNTNAEQNELIDETVSLYSGLFADGQVRVIRVAGGGRSRPLNTGIDLACGSYVTVLDDDDLVFADWVETFETTGSLSPGCVLRANCVQQEFYQTRWPDRALGYEPVGAPEMPWETEFDLISHLYQNHSPSCSYAVPMSCFHDLNLRFDEELPVVEDWDILLQSAIICGVRDAGVITSLYRRWENHESSYSRHTSEEWARATQRVVEKIDRLPLLLPQRSVTNLRRLFQVVNESHRLTAAADDLEDQRDAALTLERRTRQLNYQLSDALIRSEREMSELRLHLASQDCTQQSSNAREFLIEMFKIYRSVYRFLGTLIRRDGPRPPDQC